VKYFGNKIYKDIVIAAILEILVFVSACTAQKISPIPSSSPFLPPGTKGYEVNPTQHWRLYATREQTEQLSKYWGKTTSIGDLMDRMFPETAKEMPAALLGNSLMINWPDTSVDWAHTLTGGLISSFSSATIASSGQETYTRPTINGTFGFYCYIGKESLDKPPQIAARDNGGIPYYFVSIYISE
jgi:hypothetical protein